MSHSPSHVPREHRREPLWDRVDRNRIELAVFIAVFVLVSVTVLGAVFTVVFGVLGLVVLGASRDYVSVSEIPGVFVIAGVLSLLLSVGWVVYSLSRPEKWVVERFGCEFVPKGAEIPTKMALKDMSIAAGLAISPVLYVMPRQSVNAFVFATGKRRAMVGVTRGFIDKLSVDEQRAVFANLVARLVVGDVYTAAGVASIVWPVYAWDGALTDARNAQIDAAWNGQEIKRGSNDGAAIAFVFGVAFAVLSALFQAWHRKKQRHVAEKADAEGMLLLKEPRSMLSALQRCIEMDNTVATGSEAFADLFYCWTGPARNDHRDPEWQRVARLREVLGVEGAEVT